MTAYVTSPRMGVGTDDFESLIRDLDLRLAAQERKRVGQVQTQAVGIVGTVADLNPFANTGDKALVAANNTVYTKGAGGWAPGGTIP